MSPDSHWSIYIIDDGVPRLIRGLNVISFEWVVVPPPPPDRKRRPPDAKLVLPHERGRDELHISGELGDDFDRDEIMDIMSFAHFYELELRREGKDRVRVECLLTDSEFWYADPRTFSLVAIMERLPTILPEITGDQQ